MHEQRIRAPGCARNDAHGLARNEAEVAQTLRDRVGGMDILDTLHEGGRSFGQIGQTHRWGLIYNE